MKTPQPPGAPTNLGIVATTCHSVQIAWDPPHETGVDIIGASHASGAPRAPAHLAQLLRHSAPRASTCLGLEPICNHSGAYALQYEHNYR